MAEQKRSSPRSRREEAPGDVDVVTRPTAGVGVDLDARRAALAEATAFAELQRETMLAERGGVDAGPVAEGQSMAVMRERMAPATPPPSPRIEEPQWSRGPAPTSAFASGPLPESLPPGLQSVGVGPRPTDEVVDHYMSAHWDGTDLHEQARRFGVWPEQIGTQLDRWIPVQAPPEVRAGANLLVGLGSGLLDTFFEAFAKSIPGIGIAGHLLWGLRDGWRLASSFAEQGDWGGAVVGGIRGTIAALSGMVRNLGDVFTVAGDAAHVLAPFTLGISEAVGVPAMAIAEGCRLVAAVFDSIVLGLDVALTAYSVIRANQAEADGQFARQAAFRDIARGSAFRVIESTFKVIASWTGVVVGAVVPTGAPTTIGAMVLQSGRKFVETFGKVLGRTGSETTANVVNRMRKSGVLDSLATQVSLANDASVAVGLGDVMTRSRDGLLGADYIARESLATSGTQAALTLEAGRQLTLSLMDEGMASLEAEPPQYSQEVINQFLAEGSGIGVLDVLDFATRPSEWIGVMFAGMRWARTTALDLGLEGFAGLADLAAAALTGIAQPLVRGLEAFIVENKPALDEMLVALNQRLQEQRVTLQGIRDALTSAEQLSAWAQSFADESGQLDQFTQPMIDGLAGARIDPDALDIPGWVPEFTYRWAIEAINAAVDRAVAMVTSLRDGIRENLDDVADRVGAQVDEQLAHLQEVFAAGGEVETLLAQELAQVQQLSAEATAAITAWDGRIPLDFTSAVPWLREVADRAQGATNTARQAEFTTFVSTVAQAYVDDWKQRHADDVHENFWPSMPPHELAAVREASALLHANYDAVLASPTSPHRAEARRRKAELEAASALALGTAGQQGREALGRLWLAEERIAALALLPLPVVEIPRPEPVEVHFAYDRPRDGDAGVLGNLGAVVEMARIGRPLHVVGHASVEGSDAYNLDLGQRRADWVAEQIRAAVPGAEVTTESVGEALAGSVEADEYAHRDWRKVVVRVTGDG